METLEGNQVHVIRPVLPKLNDLFEGAVSQEDHEACWLIHPSWHMCIYKRMFESENKILSKEGVLHFLELFETQLLPFSPEVSEFIIGPLMDALSESSLYSRSPGQLIGSGSPLGLKLQKFLVTYTSLLPEEIKSGFLLKFIQKMTSRHWCAVPILFLSRALASVPKCNALAREGLLALRDVLQCTLVTHQILLRGAAQCSLLQAAMNLVDAEKVSLSDVSTFLMSLRQEESLGRGTSLWTELCDWLRVNETCFGRSAACSLVGLQEPVSLNAYVKTLVQEYVKSPAWETGGDCGVPDGCEAQLVALMVLLAVDVEGMRSHHSEKQRTQNVLRMFLEPLLDALTRAGTSAYLPLPRSERSLQLLLKLLHACSPEASRTQDDEVFTLLRNLVLPATDSIAEFILRRLTVDELSSVSDLDRCRLYLTVFTELTRLHGEGAWEGVTGLWRILRPLRNASIRHLQDTDGGQEPTLGRQIQMVVSMAALATVCEATARQPERAQDALDAGPAESFLASLPLSRTLQKPRSSVSEESSSSQGWGKVVAQYIHDQWVCLSFRLKKYHALIPASEGALLDPELPAVQRPGRTLQCALDALSVLPAPHVLPVLRCMKTLVPKLLASSESLCIEAFDTAWKIISNTSLSNTQLIFWSNLKAFVQFVFDAKVLTIAAKIQGRAYLKIKEIMYQMIEMSAIKTGVFNTLISYCCQSWIVPASSVSRGSLANAKNYSELVLEACIFGTVFRRDQRLIQDVQTFVENLGHDCAANVVIENTKREDHYVRICAVKFLCLLDDSDMSHKSFMEDLAVKLLDKDESVAKSRTRYYVNSQQHRVKNRIWQVLLVLFPRFDQNFLNRIIDKIFQAGFINNQASVKYYIEWIIILILHKFPQFLPKFWDCFSDGEENLKTSICTFLSVLSHLDVITQNIPEKTIFYILPRLSGLVEDEWIATDKFARFTDIPSDSAFQWYLSPAQLRQVNPGDWAQQDAGSDPGEADNQSTCGDVQKKVIPWKDAVPEVDLEPALRGRGAALGRPDGGLIVVASLIDKAANLGGLCRTCEVFGASALVLANPQCVNDRQFQHLSVSAEQWLPLVEVKPPQLTDYLQQKKAEGYSIIGVEQTARSVALTQYRFPEKSLLLLGNEREGIPAALIQQLDVCVEIPQQGVIRSLNVHVSGALLVWEYTRQRLCGRPGREGPASSDTSHWCH
ncbi:probable methyltransferase TARBP1 [Pteropus alecto]|uniref:probable methyltransferase TARBP1 n=1 Tax=Pteropus alecto TaxID=9402 RepID=UPI000D536BE0|nr:probable methyltransferase TARBP1 [Pteropus alecto]